MNALFRFYLSLFLRRLPAMLVLFAIFSAAGVVAAWRLPPTYEASARLIVIAPQIPTALAESTVQTSASEQLEFIRQRLLTRNNMLEIQQRFGVLEDPSKMTPDDIVSSIRDRTSIANFSRGNRGARATTLVTVSFSGTNGRIAANVVNDLVTRIIEENVTQRTDTAEGTLTFFEQEVARLNDELGIRSAAISNFQRENSDALPSDIGYRQSRLTLLQERLASAEREIASLLEQKERIQEAFDQTGGNLRLNETPQLSPEERQLNVLELELKQALTVYSETNPNVVNLRNRIELLQAQIDAEKANQTPEQDQANIMLNLRLSEIDSRVETLQSEIATTEKEVEGLVESIGRTPNVAVTLDALRRDYENTRRQYDIAQQSLNRANMGERIELTSRGQRIELIEAATIPSEPSSPNRPKIAAMGVGAGLGLAIGLFVLLEILNTKIRRPSELTKAIGVTPLATIPFIESRGRKVAYRFFKIMLVVGTLVGIVVGLYLIDTYYQPIELIVQKVMRRVGI